MIVDDTITSGAESDIAQLTLVARQMVGQWGMSARFGPIALLPHDDGQRFPAVSEVSPQTQALIDQEVQRVIDDAHRAATALLTEHRAQLDSLASALLAAETLDGPAAYAAAMVPRRTPTNHAEPLASSVASRLLTNP